MGRSARLPEFDDDEPRGVLGELLALSGRAVLRNPVAVGATTAFLITLFYVSANALWYQPHFHSDAFFATRAVQDVPAATPAPRESEPEPSASTEKPALSDEPTSAIPLPENPPERAAGQRDEVRGDPVVFKVQGVLRELGVYDGEIDGLMGPRTRRAIAEYRRVVGLEPSEEIDDELLGQLDAPAGPELPEQAPLPRPTESAAAEPSAEPESADATSAETVPAVPEERVIRIQAGLRAFGNDGIELDGVVGPETEAAIREFQTLFGLPETGRPDETLHAKMREIGLTN